MQHTTPVRVTFNKLYLMCSLVTLSYFFLNDTNSSTSSTNDITQGMIREVYRLCYYYIC